MDVWKTWLNIQEKLIQTECENICLSYYIKTRQLHTCMSSYTCTLIGSRKPALLFLNNLPLFKAYFTSFISWNLHQLLFQHSSQLNTLFPISIGIIRELPIIPSPCQFTFLANHMLSPLSSSHKRLRFYLNPPILFTFDCLSSS